MNTLPLKLNFERLQSALQSSKYTSGSTHNFYLYPARFSPEIARTVIDIFSDPGDWVLDPFMGGGTTIIEGLARGRFVIGADLNALAHFVARVRTTPLSQSDEDWIRHWANRIATCSSDSKSASTRDRPVQNLPRTMQAFIANALVSTVRLLPFPRQRGFARCVLLRLGQWALDCRDHATPSQSKLAERLPELTDQMLQGLREFVEMCQAAGLCKNEIVNHRALLCRDAAGLHRERGLWSSAGAPRLVFTSPPYPCVHVLYHRWQIQGRKETAAPYWIAQVPDGYYASHYTGGSRTPTGEQNYFAMIRSVFSSVKKVMARDGVVVQLVGFANQKTQLPRYLATMEEAGFETYAPSAFCVHGLWRQVPNRKWYANLQGDVDASSELLLFHRPRQP